MDQSAERKVVDLSGARESGGYLETGLVLPGPCSQIHVRLPASRVAGRAEALHGDGGKVERWAAKHFWSIDQETVAYEFDGPLPAGDIRLRIPVSPTG
jgi:hypothetical protein